MTDYSVDAPATITIAHPAGTTTISVTVPAAPPSIMESADLTTVPPAGQIVDAALHAYTIVGGQAAVDAVAVADTHGVTLLKYCKHPVDPACPAGVFQQSGGAWWGPVTPASGGPHRPGDPSVAAPPIPPTITPPIPPTITPPTTDTAPPQALAAGFNRLVFGPDVVTSGPNKNWTVVAGETVTNADGSVLIKGTPGYGYNLLTAVASAAGYAGAVFQGGGYFEAIFKYTGPEPSGVPVPCFWANDIENQINAANNYATRESQWPGQPAVFVDSVEWDIVEVNAGYGSMGFIVHNWYGAPGPNMLKTSSVSDGSPAKGLGDQTQYHKYAGKWEVATQSKQGYIEHYFNDRLVGNRITWNLYNPALPPPPKEGTNAFSRIDNRRMYFILGTGPNNPMTVRSVRIWQR